MNIPDGIAKIKPSNLSNKPPCPGKIEPVSLIFAFLFKYEKNKSPNWHAKEIKAPISMTTKLILFEKKYKEDKLKKQVAEITSLNLSAFRFKLLKKFPRTLNKKIDFKKILQKI